VSSIVPEMSLWSSSLWRTREKRGIREMEGGRERRRTGAESASAEAFHSPGRGWSGSHGLPPRPHSLPLSSSPPLHLALRAPLPLCSANQAHSFLRGVERECACECACMCVGVLRQAPAQGNTCIIHDGMEGLAGTQCLVRGQTVESVGPMVAGMAQCKPKPTALMRLRTKLSRGQAKTEWTQQKKEKEIRPSFRVGAFQTLVE